MIAINPSVAGAVGVGYDPARRAGPAAQAAASGEPATAGDTVSLSSAGKLLSSANLLLPTADNVEKLAAGVSGSLSRLFATAGIDADPAVTFSVDPNTGYVSATGDRADTKRIEDLINKDKALTRQMHDASAIASHVAGMAESLQFQREYRAASGQAQIDAVLAKYSDLFNGTAQNPEITMGYDGASVQVKAGGQSLSAYLARYAAS
jgi:hypothetical protein